MGEIDVHALDEAGVCGHGRPVVALEIRATDGPPRVSYIQTGAVFIDREREKRRFTPVAGHDTA
jgi:hypothetical protein